MGGSRIFSTEAGEDRGIEERNQAAQPHKWIRSYSGADGDCFRAVLPLTSTEAAF